jgi:hypothetical protein
MMLTILLAVTAAVWRVGADDTPSYNTFGTVAFIRTGERTPLIASDTPKLSALGASRMYQLGQAFRGRYIDGDSGNTLLGKEPIIGLSTNILDSNQMLVQALNAPYVIASSQAFMQGLYPAYSITGSSYADSTSILSNDTAINYPLDGYQYAPIDSISEFDPNSVYMAGQQNCPLSIQESEMYLLTQEFVDTKSASQPLYDALNASEFVGGHLNQKQM